MTGADDAPAARHLHQQLLEGCHTLKRLGYWPAYFFRELNEVGGLEATRALLRKRDTSDGFATLWELGRLDLTVEAILLLPWYRHLFTPEEQSIARWRLEENGFDVDSFLAKQTPPPWTLAESQRQQE
jgi:hypothetical protein